MPLQNLQDKYQALQQTCHRKDQALRQNRMVLKFREEALKKLEKTQKEKRELEPDEKDGVIVSVRNLKTLYFPNLHRISRLFMHHILLKSARYQCVVRSTN